MQNITQQTNLYDTHPNRRFEEGEKVVRHGENDGSSAYYGTVMGYEGVDRVWVEWPDEVRQEDVAELIGFGEFTDVARQKEGNQPNPETNDLDQDQDKGTVKAKNMNRRRLTASALPENYDFSPQSPEGSVSPKACGCDEEDKKCGCSKTASNGHRLSSYVAKGNVKETRRAAISRLGRTAKFLAAMGNTDEAVLAQAVAKIASAINFAPRTASKADTKAAVRNAMVMADQLIASVPSSMVEPVSKTCIQAFLYQR